MDYIICNGELRHHGIKGQKRGVRRYQYEDGSLTPAGKARYRKLRQDGETGEGALNRVKSENGTNPMDGVRKTLGKMAEPNIKSGKDKAPISAAEKIAKDSGKVLSDAANITNSISRMRSKPVDTSKMTDQQLRDAINRMNLEKSYASLTSERNTSRGMEYATEILGIAGSVVGIAGGIAAIAGTVYNIKKGG